jgi:hypothetical protein
VLPSPLLQTRPLLHSNIGPPFETLRAKSYTCSALLYTLYSEPQTSYDVQRESDSEATKNALERVNEAVVNDSICTFIWDQSDNMQCYSCLYHRMCW